MKQPFLSAVVAVLCCGIGFSQAPSRPAFDVADIQIHTDKETPPNAQFLPGGRVDIRNLNMKQLVLAAFNIGQGVSDKLVDGIPGWADTASYDIIAKADPKTLVTSLPTFAPRYFESPVVNGTDIQGEYDIKLDWSPVGAGGGRGPDGQHAPSDSADIAATTIFDVVQQLGFKLEKRKQPFPVVVIDRLERTPTEN